MNALGFAILIFVIVIIAVVAAIILFRNFFSARSALKVKRSFRLKGDPAGRPIKQKPQTRAGDSNRTASKSRINLFSLAAAAVFGILAVRVWALQILGGSQYSSQAESNMTSTSSIQARRGRILDRNGVELATNRVSRTVVGDSTVVDNRRVVHRLSLALGLPAEAIRSSLMDETSGTQSDKVIASDVSMRSVAYIEENPTIFPGVSVETRSVRVYSYGTVAAHILGYIGSISEDELNEDADGTNYESGDTVGKSGVEAAYERVLQGTKGTRTYRVDSSGNYLGVVDEIDPDPGNDIRLTIDINAQQVAEEALSDGLESARNRGYSNAYCGAIVALDIKTGGILAMASAPSFDPNDFVGGISQDLWSSLIDEDAGYPLTNRAIAGQYPAASTYKAFTGMAGLTYGLIDSTTQYNCEGTWTGFGETYSQNCWQTSGHGYLDIYHAISVSCDVYFYEVARSFWNSDDQALSDYLETWGFGSRTGIDIAGEMAGRVPDEEWKAEYYWEIPESAQWLPGDISNMIIGQGDVLVTPIQMAVAYAGVASGTLLKPHLLYSVQNSEGQAVIEETVEESDFHPEASETNLQIIRDGLRLVVTEGGASSVFSGFPVAIAAKSGTGETGSSERDDYAWFCAYGPVDDPQYCCACILEQGGGGTASAGPPVRRLLAQLFGIEEETVSVAETGDR